MADNELPAAPIANTPAATTTAAPAILSTAIPHASGVATTELPAFASNDAVDASYNRSAEVNTSKADPNVIGRVAVQEVARPAGDTPSAFGQVAPIIDPNVQPPVRMTVIADDVSRAERDPETEAKATETNQKAGETMIPMTPPDGAKSDGFKTDKQGRVLVPANQAATMQSQGFTVAS